MFTAVNPYGLSNVFKAAFKVLIFFGHLGAVKQPEHLHIMANLLFAVFLYFCESALWNTEQLHFPSTYIVKIYTNCFDF